MILVGHSRAAGGAPPVDYSFAGALVYNSGNQSLDNGTFTLLTFDSEVYDVGGYHSTSVNTGRMTAVKTGWVRLWANVEFDTGGSSDTRHIRILKNGTEILRFFKNSLTTNGPCLNIATPPIAAVAGDYFTCEVLVNSASRTTIAANSTWFAIEEIAGTFSGAQAQLSSDQSLSAATWTPINLGTEVFDEGGWYDTGDATKMTVPANITKAVFTGGIVVDNSSATVDRIRIVKNGSTVVAEVGLLSTTNVGSEHTRTLIQTEPIAVSVSDYYTMEAFTSGARTVKAHPQTFFAVQAVEGTNIAHGGGLGNSIKSAKATKDAQQNTSQNSFVTVTFPTEDYDTDNIHSTISNDSRMTAPSGTAYVRLYLGLKLSQTTNITQRVKILKNGADFVGAPRHGVTSQVSSANGLNVIRAVSAPVPAVSGDYFEAQIFHNDQPGGPANDLATSFTMEVVA